MKAIKNTTSVFLAIVFILSSIGFTANKMICLKSGKTKTSFVHFKDCCKKNKSNTSTLKANCCDINNTTFNLGDFQSSEQHVSPNTSVCILPSATILSESLKESNYNTSTFYHSPPPKHGRHLLSFISTFRI